MKHDLVCTHSLRGLGLSITLIMNILHPDQKQPPSTLWKTSSVLRSLSHRASGPFAQAGLEIELL